MISKLVWRHEVLRRLSKKVAVTSVSVLFLANILAFKMAESGNQSQPPASIIWLGQIVFLLAGQIPLLLDPAGKRCRPWEMGLPLPTSLLWRSHWLSLIAAGFIQILIAGGVIQLGQLGMRQLDDFALLPAGWIPPVLIPAGVGVVVPGAFLAAWPPRVVHLSDDARWMVTRVMLACGVPAVIFLLARVGMAFTLIPLPLVLLWLAGQQRRLPAALDWVPGHPAASVATGGEPTGSWHPAAPAPRVLRLVILKSLFKWPVGWIALLPFAFVMGMILGGSGFLSIQEDLRFLFQILVVYMLYAFTGNFLEKLHLVDHLPIARRTLLLWLVLPGVLSVALGYGIATVFPGDEPGAEHLVFSNDPQDYGLKVPPGIWEVVASDRPTEIVAPWGESQARQSVPLAAGGLFDWCLSKPFSTPLGSSSDFVAWQISRAVEETYGETLSPAAISATYLTSGPSGLVTVVDAGLTLEADHPRWRTRSEGPLLPFLVGSILVIYLLTLAFSFRFMGPGVTIRRTRIVCWTTMMTLLAVHLVLWFVFLIGHENAWAYTGSWMALIRDLGQRGPAAWVLTYLGMALLTGLAWRLAGRQFAQVEPPRP